MAINYLIGLTQAQLEAALAKAQAELMSGKVTVGSGAGDLTFNHSIQIGIVQRITMILNRLSELDPINYPRESVTPIDRTQVVFPYDLNGQIFR